MGLLDRFFSRTPTQDAFAKTIMTALRHAGDGREWSYDKERFQLQDNTEARPHLISLANHYAEHCSLPRSARQEHIDRIIRASLSGLEELPKDFDEARANLRPKVWLRA